VTLSDPSGLAATSGADGGGGCGELCLHLIALDRAVSGALNGIGSTIGSALYGDAEQKKGPGGVTIVNNARGIVGNFVGIFGDENSMTLGLWWGGAVIVSHTDIGTDPSTNATLAHEYGHVAQVNTLGPAYIPAYIALMVPATLDFAMINVGSEDPVSWHDWHPMEIHAQSTIPGAPLFPSYERFKQRMSP